MGKLFLPVKLPATQYEQTQDTTVKRKRHFQAVAIFARLLVGCNEERDLKTQNSSGKELFSSAKIFYFSILFALCGP